MNDEKNAIDAFVEYTSIRSTIFANNHSGRKLTTRPGKTVADAEGFCKKFIYTPLFILENQTNNTKGAKNHPAHCLPQAVSVGSKTLNCFFIRPGIIRAISQIQMGTCNRSVFNFPKNFNQQVCCNCFRA